MAEYARAAAGHPTWSVAYAKDVPVLLAEIERLRDGYVRLFHEARNVLPDATDDQAHTLEEWASSVMAGAQSDQAEGDD